MNEFPDPVPLSKEVPQARAARNLCLVRAARWGVYIRLFIIAVEFWGVLYLGSAALLLDAISSSLDIACSLVL